MAKNPRLEYLITNNVGLNYVELHREFFRAGWSEDEIREKIKLTLNDPRNSYAYDREKLAPIEITDYDIQILDRYSKNHYKRNNRLKMKIKRLLVEFKEPVFITLTFTNETLEKTSEETRRRYVSRFLKSQNVKYVANVDYGSRNNREHYHGVASGRIDPTSWIYGSCNVQKVRQNSDPLALAKYVNKLVNHAKKIENKLIYSKGLKISTEKARKLNENDIESLETYLRSMFKQKKLS